MKPSDYCRTCNGTMKLIRGFNPVMPCPVCKDSFGWDPDLWAEERKRNEEANAKRNAADSGTKT